MLIVGSLMIIRHWLGPAKTSWWRQQRIRNFAYDQGALSSTDWPRNFTLPGRRTARWRSIIKSFRKVPSRELQLSGYNCRTLDPDASWTVRHPWCSATTARDSVVSFAADERLLTWLMHNLATPL